MKKTTLILKRSDIKKLVDIKKSIVSVEAAFKDYALGQTQMPAKIYLDLKKHNGDFRAMPAYLGGQDACALKWVNVHPNNPKKGLPTVMATIILSDPNTGFPLAIMDGTEITNVRTAAAGGVAAKYLAKKNSSIIALVGCGAQAITQLEALRTLFKINEVRVWGHEKKLINAFIKKMKTSKEAMVATKSVQECVSNADIIVTTTPSRKPLVKLNWIKAGVHINAIGADAPGKQEIDSQIIKQAKIVIDDWKQASHSGEINVPITKKVIKQKDIYAEIGQIVLGKKKGRVNNQEITIFDSTGLAIQDVAVGNLIYKTAKRKKLGQKVQLL